MKQLPFVEFPLPNHASLIYQKLIAKGFEAYIVGGFVRDGLLNKPQAEMGDIDIATNAHPAEVMKIFSHTVPTGIKHGTVMVIEAGQGCEVTTYRIDGKYHDNRHPEKVFFANTILADLKRRDFTINAFAYDPEKKKIIDCFGGRDDLARKKIKAIGEPQERFAEDALRMIRACRFASQLNFEIEESVLKSIKKLAKNIMTIAIERVREELIKILISPRPSIGIEYLRKTDLLPLILPELYNTIGVQQNKYHHYDVYYHSLAVVDALEDNLYSLRLAALLHDIGKPATQKLKKNSKIEYCFYGHENYGEQLAQELLKRLKFPKKESLFVRHLIKNHMFHYMEDWSDAAVRRFIKRIKKKMIPFLFKLRIADNLGKGIPLELDPAAELKPLQQRINDILATASALTVKELAIDGNDLLQTFNLSPSPKIGEILNFLLEEVIENPDLNTKEKLLILVKNRF